MNQFVVNGVSRPVPMAEDQSFQQLISYMRGNFTTENSLMSAVLVNGIEISEKEEYSLNEIQLSDIESVEFTFCHPRELAEETLKMLVPYNERLIELSQRIATMPEGRETDIEFRKLIDGVEVLIETVTTVKTTLHVGILQAVDILEADLLSILKDLLKSLEDGNIAYRTQLMAEHLPSNLAEWNQSGIPALIRSRDS